MKLSKLRCSLVLSFVPVVCLSLASCDDAGGERTPQNVLNFGFDAGTTGCIQPSFPAEEPDVSALSPPIFLLTDFAQQSTVGQAQAKPGDPIEAEVTVNGATRRVKVELTDAHSTDHVIFIDEVDTPGNETISLLMGSGEEVLGRFFMRLTLCGLDCNEREVVFDLTPCSGEPDAGPCGVNGPYERTLSISGRRRASAPARSSFSSIFEQFSAWRPIAAHDRLFSDL
jgi:hypothetical protein